MDHRKLFRLWLRRGDVVFDVGAHAGDYAQVFSRLVGPAGRVISFEPQPEQYRRLCDARRSCRHDNVEPVPVAVTDTAGEVELFYGSHPGVDQASTIREDLATAVRLGPDILRVKVPATTLDRFVAERGVEPSFVKIDVEGAELPALRGMRALVEKTRVPVFVETGITAPRAPALEWLAERGYALLMCDLFCHRGLREGEPGREPTGRARSRLYSFTLDQLVSIRPLLTNVLAAPADRLERRLPGSLIWPLSTAVDSLGPPPQRGLWGRWNSRFWLALARLRAARR